MFQKFNPSGFPRGKSCGQDIAPQVETRGCLVGWQPDGSDHYPAIDQPSLPLIRWSLISWMCPLACTLQFIVQCAEYSISCMVVTYSVQWMYLVYSSFVWCKSDIKGEVYCEGNDEQSGHHTHMVTSLPPSWLLYQIFHESCRSFRRKM